jgi:hypothetical protein
MRRVVAGADGPLGSVSGREAERLLSTHCRHSRPWLAWLVELVLGCSVVDLAAGLPYESTQVRIKLRDHNPCHTVQVAKPSGGHGGGD